MKNLDDLVSEQDLQVCINAYRENKIGDSELHKVFSKLAKLVLASPSYHLDCPNPENVADEAADLCMIKVEKYVNGKGKAKAFNFFTTIILCYMRQTHRHYLNLRKIWKEKI